MERQRTIFFLYNIYLVMLLEVWVYQKRNV